MTVVNWSDAATHDVVEVVDRIDRDNPAAADRVRALIYRRVQRLERFPHLGRPGRLAGTRELVAHSSYVIIYTATEEAVTILRVLHTARLWPSP